MASSSSGSRFLVPILVTTLAGGVTWGGDEPAKTPAKRIDFQKDVAPILQQTCLDCHGSAMQLGGLRLDRRDEARQVLKAGRAADSLLIQRLVDAKRGLIMPPSFPFFPGEKPGLPQAQVEILTRWIDQGADWPEGLALTSDSQGGSESVATKTLLAAIRAGAHDDVSKLADASLVNAAGRHGVTPLMQAALYSDAKMVKLFLERGADPEAADPDGATALMFAAGDPEKTRLLLDKGANVDAKTKSGRTPLLIAATYAGNAEVVRLLLQKGADVRDRDQFQETPLTSACKRGDAEVVEELLKAGADVGQGGGFQGRSPLDWAAEEGSLEAVATLLKHGAGKTKKHLKEALFSACSRGLEPMVKLLLEHEAPVNGPAGFGGYTPLMAAAYSESLNVNIVQLLLDKGANPAAKTGKGDTPLNLARRRGHTKIVELLESKGAKE